MFVKSKNRKAAREKQQAGQEAQVVKEAKLRGETLVEYKRLGLSEAELPPPLTDAEKMNRSRVAQRIANWEKELRVCRVASACGGIPKLTTAIASVASKPPVIDDEPEPSTQAEAEAALGKLTAEKDRSAFKQEFADVLAGGTRQPKPKSTSTAPPAPTAPPLDLLAQFAAIKDPRKRSEFWDLHREEICTEWRSNRKGPGR